MPTRSVSELLPRPFAQLTLADVQTIIERVGEERESLFFERKETISTASLAKSCAAFANTYGGLLLVGIENSTDTFVGMEPIAEPQVWVKDVLRGHLLPLPPFRARYLPLNENRGVLLVLVEESSSTPHLVTRHGAIYVRNPGSSDPVPIQDQNRLLELTRRGASARADAWTRASGAASLSSFRAQRQSVIVALAATGIGGDFTARLFGSGDLTELRAALGEHEDTRADQRVAFWTQHSARIERIRRPDYYPIHPDRLDGIEVWRNGTAAVVSGALPWPHPEGEREREQDELLHEVLRERIRENLNAGLRVLVELGAHGDAALAVTLRGPQRLHWEGGQGFGILDRDIVVTSWTTLELDDQQRSELVEATLAEIGRALGFAPGPTSH